MTHIHISKMHLNAAQNLADRQGLSIKVIVKGGKIRE